MNMLRIDNGRIVDGAGDAVLLNGMNLGGWLMMEGYILGGRNIPAHQFYAQMMTKHGKAGTQEFITSFRKAFIRREDIERIKKIGFNCVRIPFHFKILRDPSAITFLDRVLDWCEQAQIYAILDMHAAPGCQNADWHSDSSGEALLWEDNRYRVHFVRLWKKIAERYKNRSIIAGYDILNEPVTCREDFISRLYKHCIDAIRAVGDRHIIFLEGNQWAQRIHFLDGLMGNNIAVSVHFYQPLDYTFNYYPGLAYPGSINNEYWDKSKLKRCLNECLQFQKRNRVPVFVGEFGVNSRGDSCGEGLKILLDTLSLFKQYGWHWTYWTYKAVPLGVFPNGVFQLRTNPPWVNRAGPVFGWETYPALSRASLRSVTRGLRTAYFTEHEKLSDLLARFT